MDIQVVFDPRLYAASKGLAFDPEFHELLPDGNWVRWARRVSEMETLFVYRHRVTGSYVLASWLFEPTERTGRGGVCIELETKEIHPDEDAEDWDYTFLQMRLRPVEEQSRNFKEKLRALNHKEREQKRERGEGRQTAAKWLRSKGMDCIAKDIENGSPFDAAVDEESIAMEEDLMRMVRSL